MAALCDLAPHDPLTLTWVAIVLTTSIPAGWWLIAAVWSEPEGES